MKRKGFKSFVLKVCETKGVTDAFLRNCVILKRLVVIFPSFAFLTASGLPGGVTRSAIGRPFATGAQGKRAPGYSTERLITIIGNECQDLILWEQARGEAAAEPQDGCGEHDGGNSRAEGGFERAAVGDIAHQGWGKSVAEDVDDNQVH